MGLNTLSQKSFTSGDNRASDGPPISKAMTDQFKAKKQSEQQQKRTPILQGISLKVEFPGGPTSLSEPCRSTKTNLTASKIPLSLLTFNDICNLFSSCKRRLFVNDGTSLIFLFTFFSLL